MITRRGFLSGMAGVAAASMLPTNAYALDMTRISGRAFGTRWSVLTARTAHAEELARAISALLDEIDGQMSPYRASSELSRINAAPHTDWVRVSPDFRKVAGAAMSLQRESLGAFDPRVGPLVARYGFGPIRQPAGAGHGTFEIGDDAMRKSAPGLTLDLCGIAKGHGVDRIADLIRDVGHEAFLAEIGGEFRALGQRPDGTAWRVGIEHPVTGAAACAIDLTDQALATSGDRVNSFQIGARHYSHTIDPGTGEPVDNAVASVSVIADDAMTADALATALMVMGPKEGLAFARDRQAGALFLMRSDEGLRVRSNDLFPAATMETI